MRRVVAAGAVMVAALVLGACGDDDDAGPVTDLDDRTTTTLGLEDQIVAAYEASWNDFIRAGDPPQPDAEFLTDHNTGEALTAARNLLQGYMSEGVAMRGTYEFDAQVVESADTTATVHDCGLNQLQVVRPDTGEVLDQSDDVRDGLVAAMVLEGGDWKVTSLQNSEEVCANA
ncbi:MAG TPA: hypothetical protein VH479_15030 [Acidimicrobiales bacterium]